MLQTTYKEVQENARQVDNIIKGTRAELEQSTGVGKFNYYGKRYRFEEEEERQR